MDPNANLAEQRELAARILRAGHANISPEDADRLAELVCAMDSWLRVGGFLPRDWDPSTIHAKVIPGA